MLAPDLHITVQRPLVEADTAWIGAAVLRREAEVMGVARLPVGIFARRADGTLAGGISAVAIGPDFYVHLLWVDEGQRGTGLGRALMLAAEQAAHQRGARTVFLNTVTFQAPGFYAKLGYREEGRLVDFVQGNDRHYFRKEVAPGPLPTLPGGLGLEIVDRPEAADSQAVDDGLTAHWEQHGPAYEDVAVLARDEAGTALAGLTGAVDGHAATLVYLWVREEARGRGLGRRLMQELEAIGRGAGCRHNTVYAMDWQSPAFFARLGYQTLFRIPDYTASQGRSWMRKDLRVSA